MLLAEQEDTYGSDYASITLDALRKAAQGIVPSLTEDHDAAAALHGGEVVGTCEQHDCSDPSQTLRLPLPPFVPPLERVSHFSSPSAAARASRAFILDLMPKMMYQAEPLVELLVRSRAHHYLEFKRMDGMYVLSPTAAQPAAGPSSSEATASSSELRPIPASKSDIFRDRSLSLSEKRALMGFLSGAMEAAQNTGRLKEAMAGPMPLVHVLASEGVPERLRQLVVHGIAMCDEAQEADFVAARQGAAALALLAESMSRFGGPGAFMVPSWGCGSLPEAFVRQVGARGAPTHLRGA